MTDAPPNKRPDTTNVIRTRFAPSPSGHLHVGGARTALFCWAYAKGQAAKQGKSGTFMLRIEDTDQKRSSEAASLGFLEDLRWLGILWDEGPVLDGIGGGAAGPYFQSERLDIYNHYLDQLLREGKAYEAFDSAEELKSMRDKAAAEKRNFRYLFAEQHADAARIERQKAEGRAAVIRMKMPTGFGSVTVHDQVRGDVTVNESELDDFVIRKADGYPTYHFAVVVDDELMGVTHVIRAQEHLSNTHKHQLLQDALGFARPAYAHVSIITNPDGSKMSKRDKAKAVRAAIKSRTSRDGSTAGDIVQGAAQLAARRMIEIALGKPPHEIRDKFAEVFPAVVELTENFIKPSWKFGEAPADAEPGLANAIVKHLNAFVTGESDNVILAVLLAEYMGISLPEIEVDDFRRNGYLPEVMINYLALLGWNPGQDVEKFDFEFLKDRFDFERVIKTPAKFDREKLLSFNSDAMQAMPVPQLAAHLEAHAKRYHPDWHAKLSGGGKWDLFARANQKRAKTLEAAFQSDRFFLLNDDDPILTDYSADSRKALETGVPSGFEHVEALRSILAKVEPWTVEAMEAAVKRYADEKAEGKLGKVAQPLRIAATGSTVSPAIFDTLGILGKQSTLVRIDRCCERMRQKVEMP